MFSAGAGEAASLPGRGTAVPHGEPVAAASSQAAFESLSSVFEVRVHEMCRASIAKESKEPVFTQPLARYICGGFQEYTGALCQHTSRKYIT